MSSLRFYPVTKDISYYEHMHRYHFARDLVRDLCVLDISSGEGYGSYLLSDLARKVVGGDIDPSAVENARRKYVRANLSYCVEDATCLSFPSNKFDVVVSFETIEHLFAQEKYVSEVKRVLKPDGFAIISTPDTIEYSEARNYHNETHTKEFTMEAFLDILHSQFKYVRLFGQRFVSNSIILPINFSATEGILPVVIEPNQQNKPMYFIALCSNAEFTSMPQASIFGDKDSDQEFNRAVEGLHDLEKQIIAARLGFEEKDRQIKHLTVELNDQASQISAASSSIADLKKQLQEASVALQDRDNQLDAANKGIDDLKSQLENAAIALQDRDNQLDAANKGIDDLKSQLKNAANAINDLKQQLAAVQFIEQNQSESSCNF